MQWTVQPIRALRCLRGCGLNEAHLVCDRAQRSGPTDTSAHHAFAVHDYLRHGHDLLVEGLVDDAAQNPAMQALYQRRLAMKIMCARHARRIHVLTDGVMRAVHREDGTPCDTTIVARGVSNGGLAKEVAGMARIRFGMNEGQSLGDTMISPEKRLLTDIFSRQKARRNARDR
jgi:hypothetical protein